MPPTEFERASAEQPNVGLVRECVGFIAATKKWWLAPLLIVFLLVGMLLVLSGGAAAPLIYTLF